MIYERGGKDVDLDEESKISSRPSSEYLNEKYDSVSEFDASTCSGDNFMIFWERGINNYRRFNCLGEN